MVVLNCDSCIFLSMKLHVRHKNKIVFNKKYQEHKSIINLFIIISKACLSTHFFILPFLADTIIAGQNLILVRVMLVRVKCMQWSALVGVKDISITSGGPEKISPRPPSKSMSGGCSGISYGPSICGPVVWMEPNPPKLYFFRRSQR